MEEFKNKIIQGDCLIELKTLDENSIDSIVTDPPYELGFMGKSWDNTGIANNKEMWAECLRVLKPGGHLLAFSGTRTYHRMASAIEDAGFEVRDMIEWVYGSGFPKSHNIGKNIEKIKVGGIKNLKQIGTKKGIKVETGTQGFSYSKEYVAGKSMGGKQISGDIPVYEINNEWEGWGTALKPAHEPICMARKPLAEKTVAENCLKYGTGGINIDESRVDTNGEEVVRNFNDFSNQHGNKFGNGEPIKTERSEKTTEGRWPANLLHDNSEEVRECFPNESERFFKSINISGVGEIEDTTVGEDYRASQKAGTPQRLEATDGASPSLPTNFKSIIYQAKASKSERNKGCEGLEEKVQNNTETNSRTFNDRCLTCKKKFVGSTDTICHCPSELKITDKTIYTNKNNHPTVKPIALMEYLIKMVTPKGGIVLDPFAGSGSTLVAAKQNGYQYIGIEMTEEYIPIIEARLLGVENDLFKDTL